MINTSILINSLILAIGAALCWWVFVDNETESSDSLFDFLDQTGYSIQHLPTGQWAVTNGAHKIVGHPAQNIRDAVISAIDAEVA